MGAGGGGYGAGNGGSGGGYGGGGSGYQSYGGYNPFQGISNGGNFGGNMYQQPQQQATPQAAPQTPTAPAQPFYMQGPGQSGFANVNPSMNDFQSYERQDPSAAARWVNGPGFGWYQKNQLGIRDAMFGGNQQGVADWVANTYIQPGFSGNPYAPGSSLGNPYAGASSPTTTPTTPTNTITRVTNPNTTTSRTVTPPTQTQPPPGWMPNPYGLGPNTWDAPNLGYYPWQFDPFRGSQGA